MTKKKIMMAAMSAGLVAVVGVGGTLAYLSAQSEVVNNTFTVGTGYITDDDGHTGIVLDEAKVNEDGTVDVGTRVDGNQEYPNLLPGDTKVKDPTVRFVAGSVKSYIFAKVEGTEYADGRFLTVGGWNTEDWMKVSDLEGDVPFDTTGDGYYLYVGELADSNYVVNLDDEVASGIYTEKQNVSLGAIFNSITFENVNNEQFEAVSPDFDDAAIKVSACAVQAANDGSTWEDAFGEATFK